MTELMPWPPSQCNHLANRRQQRIFVALGFPSRPFCARVCNPPAAAMSFEVWLLGLGAVFLTPLASDSICSKTPEKVLLRQCRAFAGTSPARPRQLAALPFAEPVHSHPKWLRT